MVHEEEGGGHSRSSHQTKKEVQVLFRRVRLGYRERDEWNKESFFFFYRGKLKIETIDTR